MHRRPPSLPIPTRPYFRRDGQCRALCGTPCRTYVTVHTNNKNSCSFHYLVENKRLNGCGPEMVPLQPGRLGVPVAPPCETLGVPPRCLQPICERARVPGQVPCLHGAGGACNATLHIHACIAKGTAGEMTVEVSGKMRGALGIWRDVGANTGLRPRRR